MKNLLFSLICLSICFSCSYKSKEELEKQKDTISSTDSIGYPLMLDRLTTAHNLNSFQIQEVIAFDIELYFRGKLRLEGTIYSKTNSSKVLVDRKDGTKLLFEGGEVYINSDTASTKGARFDALTWSYFALAPFKFKDSGTNWVENGRLPFDSVTFQPTLKLTFGDNVGDAPDDWYIVFSYPGSHLLKAMAYIVTFGDTPQKEAEKNPHAIVYEDYENVQGAAIATNWKFHNWSFDKGISAQLGEAKLTNIRFLKETQDLFKLKQKVVVPLK